jgi:hypothetical protein
MAEQTIIKARTGKAVRVAAGQRIKVINLHGTQVVDTWALSADDVSEYLSVEQTRRMAFKLSPTAGDMLYSNRRDEMIAIEEDTGSATHDTLIAACDKWVYLKAGRSDDHPSCQGNFRAALAEIGVEARSIVPNPLNLWMNIPVTPNGDLSLEPPLSKPGDHVTFAPKRDVIMVFSACPADTTDINGKDRTIKDAAFEVF